MNVSRDDIIRYQLLAPITLLKLLVQRSPPGPASWAHGPGQSHRALGPTLRRALRLVLQVVVAVSKFLSFLTTGPYIFILPWALKVCVCFWSLIVSYKIQQGFPS